MAQLKDLLVTGDARIVGKLYAPTFTGDLTGTATKATGDKDGNQIDTTYYKASNPNGYVTTDTKNTAGTTNSTSKIFLAGATEQSANPQTYSNVNCYASGGKLYSNAKEVVNLSDSQALTNKTYNGYTLAGASAKAVDTSVAINSSSANLPTSAAVASLVSTSRPNGVFHLSDVGGTAAVTSSPYTASKWYTNTNDNRITSLYSGLTVSFKVPVAGNGTYGTLLDVNGLGEHPVVVNVNTMVGTRYGVGATVILTYNATQTASAYDNSASATTYTGCWQRVEYDTDTTNIYQLRNNKAGVIVNSSAGALYRYEFCMTNKNGELIPFNNTSNKATTYTKAMNSQAFDPFAPIYYYNSTTTVNAGSNTAAGTLYTQVQVDCRYGLNIQSDGTAGTTSLTSNKPVYIKALYNMTTHTATFVQNVSASSYLDRSSIVQTLPTTDPNTSLTNLNTFYIYIYMGQAYTKYQIEMTQDHPVYCWDKVNSCMGNFSGGDANLSNLLNLIYPVGSIYISATATSPATLFGGTWTKVAEGRTLWGATQDTDLGTTINSGLPNITGTIYYAHWNNPVGFPGLNVDNNGALLRHESYPRGRLLAEDTYWGEYGDGASGIKIDASNCNSIYGGSTIVQPPAFQVYMWQRTA